MIRFIIVKVHINPILISIKDRRINNEQKREMGTNEGVVWVR